MRACAVPSEHGEHTTCAIREVKIQENHSLHAQHRCTATHRDGQQRPVRGGICGEYGDKGRAKNIVI